MYHSPDSCTIPNILYTPNISTISNSVQSIIKEPINYQIINNEITINYSNKNYIDNNFPCEAICDIINTIYSNNNNIIISINISNNDLSNDYIKQLINKFIEFNIKNNRRIIKIADIRGNYESFKYNYIEDYYIIWK